VALSAPVLDSLAALLITRVAPAALVGSLGFWLVRWRRLSGICLALALLVALGGAVAALYPLCPGYIAADGECAEE
jgi:hypothetical protein